LVQIKKKAREKKKKKLEKEKKNKASHIAELGKGKEKKENVS